MSSQKPGCLAALFGIGRKNENVNISIEENDTVEKLPYKEKMYFLSNAEASFYHFLKQMVGENVIIFPHVSLRDLVAVTERVEYYTYYNQIDRKQVDFVLVESTTLKPRLVVELDDSSHQREDRKQRDIFVEKVLAVAQIPIARIPVKKTYDTREVSEIFRQAMQVNQPKISKTSKNL